MCRGKFFLFFFFKKKKVQKKRRGRKTTKLSEGVVGIFPVEIGAFLGADDRSVHEHNKCPYTRLRRMIVELERKAGKKKRDNEEEKREWSILSRPEGFKGSPA